MMTASLFDETLAEARSRFRFEAKLRQTTCPCCDRVGMYRRRSLNRGAAYAAAWLSLCAHGRPGCDPLDVDEFVHLNRTRNRQIAADREYAHLKYWDLAIKKLPDPKSKTNNSGKWKLTQRGFDFVAGLIRVPSHAIIYNDTVEEFSGKLVSIRECFKTPFDFSELMKGGYLDDVKT